MHTQLHGRADFKDLVAHRELLRYRKINLILWILAFVSAIFTYFSWNFLSIRSTFIFGIICVLLLVALGVRYGLFKYYKKYKYNKKRKNWEKLEAPPEWIARKRHKLGKHFFGTKEYNGDYYRYRIVKKRNQSTEYYRRLK
jgi:predicted membrane protein